jgi:hypothetical protein
MIALTGVQDQELPVGAEVARELDLAIGRRGDLGSARSESDRKARRADTTV